MNGDPTPLPEETMPPKTLEALRGSIAKWERVVSTGDSGTRWSDCSLCVMFIDDGCKGCPVRAATGKHSCRDSPYVEYKRIYDGASYDVAYPGKLPQVIAAAQKELDFLKSLLPKEAA